MRFTFLLLAQETGFEQQEYLAATALVIGLIVLGLIAICIPRPRKKHFVEPREVQEQESKSRKPRIKR